MSSRPLSEPALTSCGSLVEVVAGVGCGLAVAAGAPGVVVVFGVVVGDVFGVVVFGVSGAAAVLFAAAESLSVFGVLNGLGIRDVSAFRAGERPSDAT